MDAQRRWCITQEVVDWPRVCCGSVWSPHSTDWVTCLNVPSWNRRHLPQSRSVVQVHVEGTFHGVKLQKLFMSSDILWDVSIPVHTENAKYNFWWYRTKSISLSGCLYFFRYVYTRKEVHASQSKRKPPQQYY